MKLYYNSKLKGLSRKLRNNSTIPEVLLWKELKGRKIKGYQFTRQKPINNFIVDFYCSKLKLVIEIDGDTHDCKIESDDTRQKKLELIGLTILRFNNRDIKYNLEGVLETILNWIDEHNINNPPTPLL